MKQTSKSRLRTAIYTVYSPSHILKPSLPCSLRRMSWSLFQSCLSSPRYCRCHHMSRYWCQFQPCLLIPFRVYHMYMLKLSRSCQFCYAGFRPSNLCSIPLSPIHMSSSLRTCPSAIVYELYNQVSQFPSGIIICIAFAETTVNNFVHFILYLL
jgi:hypothetical protein